MKSIVRGDYVFVGRQKELNKLNEMYHDDQFQCIIMYGRRRVGKHIY